MHSVSLFFWHFSPPRLIGAAVAIKKVSCKWDFQLWPKAAKKYGLVLTGWGPNMCSDPTGQWADKHSGGLTRNNWMHLVWRIPQSWRNNLHYKVPDDELALKFVKLENFLSTHPGTWLLMFPADPCSPPPQSSRAAILVLSTTLGKS